MRLKPMWPHIRDAAIGVSILAAIFPGLAFLKVPVMLVAYALLAIVGGLNIILFAVVVIILVVAARYQRPGLRMAPVLFAAIWISAAIAQRIVIQAREDPKLADRSVPADLRQARTLIFEGQGTEVCCGQVMLLADGHIDRYVRVEQDNRQVVSSVTEFSLGRGLDCSAKRLSERDRGLSALLARTGRTDECILSKTTNAIPDGVVVRMHYFDYVNAMGCCHRGTISQRINGSESIRATWFFGRRPALSFLPFFGAGIFAQPVPLWLISGGGPIQPVEIGGPAFRREDIASAIYRTEWHTFREDRSFIKKGRS